MIDASRLFREGLRRIFSGFSFATVHESCSVPDALPSIESLQPSLVLVNLLGIPQPLLWLQLSQANHFGWGAVRTMGFGVEFVAGCRATGGGVVGSPLQD